MEEMRGELRVRRSGAVVVVEATSGVFDLATARCMAAAAVKEAKQGHVVKAVYDLRRAVIVISDQQLDRLALEMKEAAVDAPVAMLVDPSYHEAIWRYCLAMAKFGRTRLPFTDPRSVQRWLGTDQPCLRPTSFFELGLRAGLGSTPGYRTPASSSNAGDQPT